MLQNCPECKSAIPKDAFVCPVCTQRIQGTRCPDCLAFSPEGVKVCRYCQHKFKADVVEMNNFRPFQVKAEAMATLLLNHSFFPQKAQFFNDKIIITSYGFLGLSSHDEEIPWEKVAGFTHRSGIFWDAIAIETRGQSATSISCLKKDDALKIRNVLQAMER